MWLSGESFVLFCLQLSGNSDVVLQKVPSMENTDIRLGRPNELAKRGLKTTKQKKVDALETPQWSYL